MVCGLRGVGTNIIQGLGNKKIRYKKIVNTFNSFKYLVTAFLIAEELQRRTRKDLRYSFL